MKRLLLLMLLFGMVVTLSPGYAMAYSGPSYYAMGSMNGVKYLTGGVGLSERAHMQEMGKELQCKTGFCRLRPGLPRRCPS